MKARKGILITLTALVTALAAAAFLTVSCSGGSQSRPDSSQTNPARSYPMLAAVPSDAAMIFCFKNMNTALEIISDTTALFGTLATDSSKGPFKTFTEEAGKTNLGELGGNEAIISLHYSGDLAPLLIVDAGSKADSSAALKRVVNLALDAGLNTGIVLPGEGNDPYLAKKKLLLVSRSETIINSSIRHIKSGMSVIDADSFRELPSLAGSSNAILVSGSYFGRLAGTHVTRDYLKYTEFLRHISPWAAFTVEKSSTGYRLDGYMIPNDDPSCYFNVWKDGGKSAESKVASVLPANTEAVFATNVPELKPFFENRKRYLDSAAKLEAYLSRCRNLKKSFGQSPEEWAISEGIKEVAVADIHFGKKLEKLLFLRTSPKKAYKGEFVEWNRKGYASILFGDLFDIGVEESCWKKGEFLVVGKASVVEAFSQIAEDGLYTLEGKLSDASLSQRMPSRGTPFWMYWSAGEDLSIPDHLFRTRLAAASRNMVKGVNYTPVNVKVQKDGGSFTTSLEVDRVNVAKATPSVEDRDTSVTLTNGPYEFLDAETGVTEVLYQSANKFICLKEKGGKGKWAAPFKQTICGRVSAIDYYNNGKYQFLFGAGSSLHLLDRTGRFVGKFPVDLGKEILIGPDLYEKDSPDGPLLMILHTDNTISYYDLKGGHPALWQDIVPPETAKGLPELFESKHGKFWVVRTSVRTLIYPYNGGEPVVNEEGKKMVRPDSKISMKDANTFTLTCYDGKTRNIKMKKNE